MGNQPHTQTQDPESSTKLEFICPSFDVEDSTDCVWDRLTVAQHGDNNVHRGSDSPDGTLTNDGWARITWFSNSKTTAPGFRCFVWCRQQTTTEAATTTTEETTTEATTTEATTTPVETTTPAETTTPVVTTTPAETTPAETTPAETTAAETTPAETTPAETTPAE